MTRDIQREQMWHRMQEFVEHPDWDIMLIDCEEFNQFSYLP